MDTIKVYAIRDPHTGRIKIGSGDPVDRLRQCRTWIPDAELIATGEGGEPRERQLHRDLGDHRHRFSEWFDPHPEVITAVAGLPVSGDPVPADPRTTRRKRVKAIASFGQFITYLRQINGLQVSELAAKVGVSPATITKWETDRGVPGKHFVALRVALRVPDHLMLLALGADPIPADIDFAETQAKFARELDELFGYEQAKPPTSGAA